MNCQWHLENLDLKRKEKMVEIIFWQNGKFALLSWSNYYTALQKHSQKMTIQEQSL